MPDFFAIDIISIILLLSILQGLIFSIVSITNKGHHMSSRILAMIMLVLVWYQFEFFLVREVIEWNFDLIYGTRYGSWLILGPLIYIYALSFTSSDFKLKWKYAIYFIPFLVFTIALPLIAGDLIPERGKYYGMLTVMKLPKMGLTGIQAVYGILFFVQFIYTAAFTFLSYRKVLAHSKVVENNFSDVSYAWVSRIIFSTGIILVTAIAFFILLYFSSIYDRWMDHFYVIPVTLLIYWISFGGMRKNELTERPMVPIRSWEKYEKSSLTEIQAGEIVTKLKETLSKDKSYLNNELTLSNLADQLSVSPHYLSQVINEKLNTSFYNLINEYRVEEAKRLLKESNGDKTILQIAFDSGFNNKVSFNNYFKRHTGMTPKDFIKQKS